MMLTLFQIFHIALGASTVASVWLTVGSRTFLKGYPKWFMRHKILGRLSLILITFELLVGLYLMVY
jgi:hypothetical protein